MVAAVAEPEGPTVVVEAPDDPDVRASLTFPTGWRLEAPRDEISPRFVNALGVDERCEVGTRRSDFTDLTTEIDDFEVTLTPGSGFIFLARDSVELPAGPAERVDFATNEEGGRWSVYAAWDDGYVQELWCRGDYATSDSAVCALSDYSAVAEANGWTAVDDMHDEYVAVAETRDNLTVNEADYLDLGAGRTGFVDIGLDDGTRAVRYTFGNGAGSLLALFCVGDPTPDDRYRPLAESFVWTVGPEADEQP